MQIHESQPQILWFRSQENSTGLMGSGWFWLRWVYFRSLETQTAVGRGAVGWWSSAREGFQGRFGAPVYFLAVLVSMDMQCISSIDGEGKVRLKGSCAQQMSQDACKRTLSQMFSRSEGPGSLQRRLSDLSVTSLEQIYSSFMPLLLGI